MVLESKYIEKCILSLFRLHNQKITIVYRATDGCIIATVTAVSFSLNNTRMTVAIIYLVTPMSSMINLRKSKKIITLKL